jgi:SP family myo-inositol transporter-like MFS transporter 13
MTVPIYLAECAPVRLRGRLTVADNMAITAGQFVAAVIGYGFSYMGQGWRYVMSCL